MGAVIDETTIQALANANRAATIAVASIPTGVFQHIAQVQQQLTTYLEPIRKAMEIFYERMQAMWEQIREAINGIVKSFAFALSFRPIYYVQSQPRPAVQEKRLDRHLTVETSSYGFFIIGGRQLKILHPNSSICGRLFAALLERRAQVVSYKELQAEIGAQDVRKAFKDLKYQLKQQGYAFEYELVRTEGIALVGLKQLQ